MIVPGRKVEISVVGYGLSAANFAILRKFAQQTLFLISNTSGSARPSSAGRLTVSFSC
jgi:hypothetical protein